MTQLCLILPDQLTLEQASLRMIDPAKDHLLMCEIKPYLTEVKHHQKKNRIYDSGHASFQRLVDWQRLQRSLRDL